MDVEASQKAVEAESKSSLEAGNGFEILPERWLTGELCESLGAFTWLPAEPVHPVDEFTLLSWAQCSPGDLQASAEFPATGPAVRKTVWGQAPSGSRPVPLPLRDFYVAMPHLMAQSADLVSLPHQVKVALSFLRAVCPREIVTDETAAKLSVLLPPQRAVHAGRRTLVLDLDETLVHCHPSPVAGAPPPSLHMRIEASNLVLDAHVYVRPFTRLALEMWSRVYEVVVFTASAAVYADRVLDFLDPQREFIAHRLYRQHCTEIYGGHFKDVRRLGRRIEDVVLVDNSPLALGLCPDNGVLVSSWFGDDYADTELLDLIRLLEHCTDAACPSLPEFLIARYGISEFLRLLRCSNNVPGLPGIPMMAQQQQQAQGLTTQVQRH